MTGTAKGNPVARGVAWGVLAFAGTLLVLGLIASARMGMDGGMAAWMWLWMAVPVLLLAGLVGVAVWAAVRASPGTAVRPEDAAVEAARLRYARGDLSHEEYGRLMEALQRRPGD